MRSLDRGGDGVAAKSDYYVLVAGEGLKADLKIILAFLASRVDVL